MKKIIVLLIISFCLFSSLETRAFTAKHIDLRLKDNETGIIFLRLKNSNSILVTDNQKSSLFVLEYKSEDGIKEALKIFGKNPDIFYLQNNIDKKIGNIHITKKQNILKFQINNYMLCVYDNVPKGSCDFVYLRRLNQEFYVNENTSVIFYDDAIDKKWLKQVQESWIESNIVSDDSFTILKLREEYYNVVIVPSTKPHN